MFDKRSIGDCVIFEPLEEVFVFWWLCVFVEEKVSAILGQNQWLWYHESGEDMQREFKRGLGTMVFERMNSILLIDSLCTYIIQEHL